MKEESRQQKKAPVLPSGRRTAVIVGASSGIGKEVALKLSGRGWRVYNLSRTPSLRNESKP